MNIAIFSDTGFIEGGSSVYANLIAETLSGMGNNVIKVTDRAERDAFPIRTCKIPLIRILRDAPLFKSLGQLKERFGVEVLHINIHHPRLAYHFAKASNELELPLVTTTHSYSLLCLTGYYVRLPELYPCNNSSLSSHCATCMISKAKLLKLHMPKVVKDILSSPYYDYAKKYLLTASHVISPSKRFAELLRESVKAKVVSLPNPLPKHFLNEQSKTCGDGSAIFLGRLIWEKGVTLLPSIARHLNPGILHVLGWGMLESWLVDHVPPNVVYHGFLGEERLRLMRNASIVIIPSITSEMYPYVVLESLALGKPVVAFDLGGPKEQIERSRGGLLAKPFEVDNFSEKVNWLLENPRDAEEMGLYGREWAQRNLDPIHYGNLLMKIYMDALGKH